MASKGHEPTDSPGDVASVVKKPITRRDFLKVAGGTGAVVAASGGLSGVLAACGSSGSSSGGSSQRRHRSHHQGRVRHAADRPPGHFGARPVHRVAVECRREGRGQVRRRPDSPDPDHRQGLAVRHQQGRDGRRRPHHQRQRRHHDGRLDARHREPGGRPGRSLWRCRASPTTARGSLTSSVARAPRQAGALQVDLPRLLGSRGRDGGLHRHVGQAPDQQAGRRDVAERRRRHRLGQRQDRPAADARRRPATSSSTAAASRTARRTTRRRSPSSSRPAPRS